MKCIYKDIAILSISLIAFSCSFSSKQTSKQKEDSYHKVELIVLDPGHFHASLLQKSLLADVSDTVRVYAPKGTEVNQYLDNINAYNQREENPTSWQEQVYTGDDYLLKMISERKGDVVVLAGNNQKKTKYILESIKAGYNVLSDKPMAINKQDFDSLTKAYQLAKEKKLMLYDLMTERYDILNCIEKSLLHNTELFGKLQKGSLNDPAITMQSTHHFFKTVSDKPLIRPGWYYDIEQQGEGISDVTTHLIDLVNWQYFSNVPLHYQSDVKVLSARHWPTRITLPEFSQSTQLDSFPSYLKKYIRNNKLEVLANGTINYTVKGINIAMTVIWNYAPPKNGGDTFTSIKKGSKATLEIIQNKENGFTKQLYIRKAREIKKSEFESQLQIAVKQLQTTYPFLTVKKTGEGLYLINIPLKERLGHEAHFSKVAETFLNYLHNKNMPEWENEHTISKYYITTTAVELAKQENKQKER